MSGRPALSEQSPEADDDGLARLFESEFDYLTRRARDEGALAVCAKSPRAAITHKYLAAAYSVRIAGLTAEPPEFRDLPAKIS